MHLGLKAPLKPEIETKTMPVSNSIEVLDQLSYEQAPLAPCLCGGPISRIIGRFPQVAGLLPSLRVGPPVKLVYLCGANLTGAKIDCTREAINFLPAEASADSKLTGNPVLPAGIIVDRGFLEIDVRGAETGNRPVSNGILTYLHRLIPCVALFAAKVTAVKRPRIRSLRPLLTAIFSAIVRLLTRSLRHLGSSLRTPILRETILGRGTLVVTPEQVERIALGSALAIHDPNDCSSIVAGTADQGLVAPAVYSSETEVRWICGHRCGAFKPPPLWRLSTRIPKVCRIPTNLDLGRAVHYNFDGAFAPIRIAAIHKSSFA
jgi:hypothetical protein